MRWLGDTGLPVLDAQGRLVGYRGSARDVTEDVLRRQAEARLPDVLAEPAARFERSSPVRC